MRGAGGLIRCAFMATINPALVTTALDLPGYRLVRNVGMVAYRRAPRSIVGTIGASLQTLVGGNITRHGVEGRGLMPTRCSSTPHNRRQCDWAMRYDARSHLA